jgi:hypothetical protein
MVVTRAYMALCALPYRTWYPWVPDEVASKIPYSETEAEGVRVSVHSVPDLGWVICDEQWRVLYSDGAVEVLGDGEDPDMSGKRAMQVSDGLPPWFTS